MNVVEVVEEQVQQVQEIEWTTCGRRLRTRALSVAVSLQFSSATTMASTSRRRLVCVARLAIPTASRLPRTP